MFILMGGIKNLSIKDGIAGDLDDFKKRLRQNRGLKQPFFHENTKNGYIQWANTWSINGPLGAISNWQYRINLNKHISVGKIQISLISGS